jgi:hypothetical protein
VSSGHWLLSPQLLQIAGITRAQCEQTIRDASVVVNETTLQLLATALALELLAMKCAAQSEKWKRFSLSAKLWMARQDTHSGKSGSHIQCVPPFAFFFVYSFELFMRILVDTSYYCSSTHRMSPAPSGAGWRALCSLQALL